MAIIAIIIQQPELSLGLFGGGGGVVFPLG